MAMSERLGIKGSGLAIDWDITPEMTFTMFESWGGKDGERIRNNNEKFYYFFIDAWQDPPQVCLMERGVKHARVMARIDAPEDMVRRCISSQGKKLNLDRSYEVNGRLKDWLIKNILEEGRESLVEPIEELKEERELGDTGLPIFIAAPDDYRPEVVLRSQPAVVVEEELAGIIRAGNFFDHHYNPTGDFVSQLMDNGDNATVVDLRTGLMWQRSGCDITNIRRVRKYVETVNQENLAGHGDWRLPTLVEALSMMRPEKNDRGQHLDPCFSDRQPFIFAADRRDPGGYWFIDYKQGTVFWASGTIPGGFGRLCRTL